MTDCSALRASVAENRDVEPAPTDPAGSQTVQVLFTCTANRVRSPLAEAIARSHIERLALPAQIRSAGQLEGGRPAVDEMVEVAKRMGHDLSGHRSTQMSVEILEGADLIVTMTGQQVIDLVGLSPASRTRTITLKEWAAAVSRGVPMPEWSRLGVSDWAAAVSVRPLTDLLSGRLDIDDPIGRPKRYYKRAAAEIDDLLAVCFPVG